MQYNGKEALFKKLIKANAEWVGGKGPLSDIVVSSRIRLARNIENIPFPARACQTELKKVFELIQNVIEKSQNLGNFDILLLNKLSPLESQFLVEKNLISIYIAKKKYSYRGSVFNKQETLSIMINEEDHLRIQSLD